MPRGAPPQPAPPDAPVVALAGGVGAARFLRGLVEVVPPSSLTMIGNTGDDECFHGLHVSPDLDSVTYTLADAANPDTGWGLAGETFHCLEALERYGAPTWFGLGDRDLATHLHRTARLADGASLAEVTAEIVRAWGLAVTLLPMSNEPVPTVVETVDGERLAMQEWFVARRAEPPVRSVDLAAARTASPAPSVLDAIEAASAVIICPSNPAVSIAPILAVDGVRSALAARREHVVAVSPIVGGAAVRGPADRLLRWLGVDASAAGVAGLYADLCGSFVLDEVDRDLAPAVESSGPVPVVAPTLMHDRDAAAALASATLDAVP